MDDLPSHRFLKHLIFLFLGGLLLFLAFRNQPIAPVFDALSEANYFWAVLVIAISIGSHLARALRWNLLIASLGNTVPRLADAFFALMLGYMVNLGIPRMGEISRCVALSKASKHSFQQLFGTVVLERAVDILSLLLVIVLALSVEHEALRNFYLQEIAPSLGDALSKKSLAFRAVGIIVVLSSALLMAYLLLQWKKIKRKHWLLAITRVWRNVWTGLSSIGNLRNPWPFIAYSLGIWGSYYLMTYLWFFCFEATQGMSMKAGLAMMVIGSVARSLPIQGGGAGAYHYLFVQALLLYQIDPIYGTALAILVHGAQVVYNLLAGIAAMLWFGFSNK